jgi:ribonucleoside-diphosphate reductase alpha chain
MMLRVRKRDGQLEKAQFGKVTNRIEYLARGVLRDGTIIGPVLDRVSAETVAKAVITRIADQITTTELDEFAAKYCASLATEDHQYTILGGRIAASNHQKNTISSFVETMRLLYENKHPDTGKPSPILKRSVYKFITRYGKELEAMIDSKRDFLFDYFGFETLRKTYLLKRQDEPGINIVETPQHMYMRVAVAINHRSTGNHNQNMAFIKETYDALSLGRYSHASPTMYNAGTPLEQLASCFLLGIADSMVDEGGIPDCWKACAEISKCAGGIGIGMSPIRAAGTLITGTGGKSDGLVPMLRVFNNIARYVNQGGRRPGAFKITIEPWHPDIFDFLDLKKNNGAEERRCRDLNFALWVPDIFMRRLKQAIEKNEPVMWSLMCPHKCPDLYTTYGAQFDALYEKYENEGRYNRQVDITVLWYAILASQKETGGPDILFKDSINSKNNQANLGVIRNSNLCSEILEYSDENEYAVCNLASMSYVAFVKKDQNGMPYFDFEDFMHCCKVAHINMDKIIDINHYPMHKCRKSNLRHRPLGQGTQGFADALLELGLSFEVTNDAGINTINPKTREFNLIVAECFYYACLESSMNLAKERHVNMKHLSHLYKAGRLKFKNDGLDVDLLSSDLDTYDLVLIDELRPIEPELDRDSHWGAYSSFLGSPISEGKLQYHLWGVKPRTEGGNNSYGISLDWESLITSIMSYGVRNSLVRADMPTASTAQILGNSECTEPYKYVIYTRRVTAGEYVVVNRYLHQELQDRGLWNNNVKKDIVRNRGSIQNIIGIPTEIKLKYLTAFEISKKTIQTLAADRGPFIDQTQSTNMHVARPTDKVLTNMHIGGWKMGLKTGMYYLRREKTAHPIQFTVDGGFKIQDTTETGDACTSGGCSA